MSRTSNSLCAQFKLTCQTVQQTCPRHLLQGISVICRKNSQIIRAAAPAVASSLSGLCSPSWAGFLLCTITCFFCLLLWMLSLTEITWMDHLDVSVVLWAGTCFSSNTGGKSKVMCTTGGKRNHTKCLQLAREGSSHTSTALEQGLGFQQSKARVLCREVNTSHVAQMDLSDQSHLGAELKFHDWALTGEL